LCYCTSYLLACTDLYTMNDGMQVTAANTSNILVVVNASENTNFDDPPPPSWYYVISYEDASENYEESIKRFYPNPIQTNNVFVTLVNNVLNVQQLDPLINLMVFVNKDDVSQILTCNVSICSFIVPPRCFMISGYLDVMVTDGISNVYFQDSFYLYSNIVCIRSTKLLWFFDFATWSCLTGTEKFIAVVIILMIIWFLLFLLRWIWCFLVWIFLLLTLPFRLANDTRKGMIESESYKKVLVWYDKYLGTSKYDIEAASSKKADEMNVAQARNANERLYSANAIPPYELGKGSYDYRNGKLWYVVTICCLITCANAQFCTNGLTMSFKTDSCTKFPNNTLSCSGIATLAGTLPFVSSSVCFNLMSGTTVMGSGFVTYEAMSNVVTMATQYYTSSWTLASQSVRNCPSVGRCGVSTAGGCPNITNDKTMGGTLTDPLVLSFPGNSGCMSSSGCWTYGCFICTSACIFWGWGAVPVGDVFSVMSPIKSTLIPNISMTIGGQTVWVAANNDLQYVNDIGIAVTGSLNGPTTIFGSNNLVVGNDAYLCQTSPVNNPMPGTIGEIQSNSAVNLQLSNPSGFLVSPTLVSMTQVNNKAVFNTIPQGIANSNTPLPFCTELPSMYAGDLWYYNGDFLQSQLTSPGPVNFQVQTTSDFTFTTIIGLACPTMSVKETSGCYGCSLGSVINVTAKSTCLAAVCSLAARNLNDDNPYSSVNLYTTSVSLGQEDEDFIINFQTSNSNNDFRICVVCTGGTICQRVTFTASQDIVLKNNSWISTSSTIEDVEGMDVTYGLKWWNDLFSLKTPMWQSAVAYIVIILIVIAAILVLPVVISNLRSCFNMFKGMTKKQKTM
jgi:hypothetical protein